MAEGESAEVIERAVVAIGDALCRSAIWRGDRCNWFGRCAEEMDATTHAITPMVSALEADLYAGSAGVALFLARLAMHTGAAEYRRAALGGLRRSLAGAGRLAPLGMYSGRLGVAHALVQGGGWLRDDTLIDEGFTLAREAVAAAAALPTESEPIDVIAGLAGAIQVLVGLARQRESSDLEDAVRGLAERLVARAHRGEEGGWSWPERGGIDEAPPLSGLSHGAAGIGLALVEAHAHSGAQEMLDAAEGAWAFEHTLFDADQRNWMDLREWVIASAGPRACGVTWCHGAPGIALSRLRTIQLRLASARAHADAIVAVETTRDELRRRAKQSALDATLCHGTSGLAETLLVAGTVLDRRDLLDEAREIAERLASGALRGELTSGVPSGGPNPSLMLGTAGVGWFLLRVLDPYKTPSILTSAACREGTP